MKHGFTYSQKYANHLGFTPEKLLGDILSDLNFDSIRLCAYWDLIQPDAELWEFGLLDDLVKISTDAGLEITIALGQKVPRWPEHHVPRWAEEMMGEDFDEALRRYIRKTVTHFRDNPSVVRFQVENEPLLDFGEKKGGMIDRGRLKLEIEEVRKLTKKNVMTSASADLQDWVEYEGMVDELGVNLYTKTFTKFGPFEFYKDKNISADYYREKLKNYEGTVLVAELQAESWGPGDIRDLDTKKEWEKSMSPEILRDIYDFAGEIGFDEVWFWGVEWWWYLEKNFGYSGMRKMAEDIIN